VPLVGPVALLGGTLGAFVPVVGPVALLGGTLGALVPVVGPVALLGGEAGAWDSVTLLVGFSELYRGVGAADVPSTVGLREL